MAFLELIAYIAGISLSTYIVTIGWFLALTKAQELKDSGVKFNDWLVKYPTYVFLAGGAVFDVLFNAIWGTIIFRELPKEFFFTSRVKRHVKSHHPKAVSWKERINKISPGHI